MSQGPLCPNLSQKVQKEVSQMANRNLSRMILLGGLSVNLNHLKTQGKATQCKTKGVPSGNSMTAEQTTGSANMIWPEVTTSPKWNINKTDGRRVQEKGTKKKDMNPTGMTGRMVSHTKMKKQMMKEDMILNTMIMNMKAPLQDPCI